MFVAANFLVAVAKVFEMALDVYWWVVIARAVLSWVNPDPYNPIVRFIYNATEPVLYRIRRTLPFAYAGGLDLSPIIVLAGIMFLQIFLVKSLLQMAVQLQ